MRIREFIQRFKSPAIHELISWSIDPYEGLDFLIPSKVISDPESHAMTNPLFGMQFAYLKALVEQNLADRNSNGFTIPSATVPELEDDFFTLFELPAFSKGKFKADIRGNTANADFSVNVELTLGDGGHIPSAALFGPFLKVAEGEVYRLSAAEYRALNAVENHGKLPPEKRGEYENNWLILQLQVAKKSGMPIDLAHFNNLELSSPESVGVSLEELPNGDVLLTPTFGSGINIADIQSRLGQMQPGEDHCILRVKNRFVLLNEARLNAAQEILTNRRIPKSQVANFLRSPTAYLNAALIDLDTGFSLRVHGAERFVHRYFGDVEKSGVDWFSANSGEPEPIESIAPLIDSDESLAELERLIEDAQAKGAEIIDFDGKQFDISDGVRVKGAIDKIKSGIIDKPGQDRDDYPEDEPEGDKPGPGRAETEQAVVAIDTNDEDIEFQKDARVMGLDLAAQSFEIGNLKRTPFPHQEEGIQWLLAHLGIVEERGESSGALLADDMGLGKTFMTLVSVAEWNRRKRSSGLPEKPTLIVAPLSLLENWQVEVDETFNKSPFADIVVLQSGGDMSKFRVTGAGRETQQEFSAGDRIEDQDSIRYSLKIGSVYGSDRLDMPGRLVLTTYQTLRDYQFSLSRVDWGIVAFDEAQNIKNPNTLATRAAKGLKADFKLLATGTPVENSLKDFWCLFDTAEPGLLGSWKSFRETYIQPILDASEGDGSGVKIDVGKSLRAAVGDYMLRRTKAEKLKGLPEKRVFSGDKAAVNEQYMDRLAGVMNGRQLSCYDDIVQAVKSSTADDKRGLILPSLHNLKITSIHPDISGSFRPAGSVKELLQQAEISSKISAMVKLLHEIKEREEKVLIFATTKSVQAYVCTLVSTLFKVPVEIINGETKAVPTKKDNETRKSIIDRFQSQPGFGAIVMSPIAAGVGLTVVGANNVIHLERHWNPAKEAQATDRVYRIGQTKPVNVYIPMALHPEVKSFDLQLNSLLSNKIDLSDAVVAADTVTGDDLAGCF
ncbi:DEAD/DEAH box helicase [Pseudomaricurvus sp. HS19]|uniref:DEAD/DEAH box helicase n=1 Tax=Pseudomaricurvus sp. HS19 TaxID=2692626 RepID=UPI00136E234F|nr:DEAD/DEAH box helicase [Pseudomaricurvus sp. HS19]MYM64493.1 ATP-dependent helicase [Pseudomaricurvus sp. HS19]